MADILKISKTYYWQLENNKRRMSYEMAVKIADIFKLKPDDLFYYEFKPKINLGFYIYYLFLLIHLELTSIN